MTTLTTAPLATLLPHLLEQAAQSNVALTTVFDIRTPEQRAAMFARANNEYRDFYAEAKDLYLAVSPETGTLLYMLARAQGARAIVEFGTSFGISTLHLAAAIRDNGGGHLIGSEFEASKAARARENLEAAGLADLVEIREGDALDSLARDLPASIDFVLLDGAKSLYPRILPLLEPRLAIGAIIVADNADASPEYLARVRNVTNGYLSVPFGDEVEVSMRIA